MLRLRLLALLFCAWFVAGCATLADEKSSAQVVFVTTPHTVVNRMLQLASVAREDVVHDLGSGDGRIVIAAARNFGARGVGVEIDPNLIRESEENARSAGVGDRVQFVHKDLFQVDLREATVVTLFLLPGLNQMLAPRFMKELRPGTRIVSHMFDMGEWQPDKTIKVESSTVYYWVKPVDVAGTWRLDIPTAQGFGPLTLSVRQAYQKLGGSVRLQRRRLDLREPRIEGEKLFFVAAGTVDGEDMQMSFSGSVLNDVVTGSVEIKGGSHAGTHEWTTRRTL